MLARPHVIVMPVMVAWVATLVRAMDRRGRPPFFALPLLVLWANLHGSVSFGVFLIGAAALEALWGAPRRDWLRIAGPWALFGLLALAAASLTPYGPGILLVPLETFSAGKALTTIVEWRPQDFGKIGTFELLLLAGIGYALLRGLTLMGGAYVVPVTEWNIQCDPHAAEAVFRAPFGTARAVGLDVTIQTQLPAA